MLRVLKGKKTAFIKAIRRTARRVDAGIRHGLLWPFTKLWRFTKLRPVLRPMARFVQQHHRITAGLLACLILFTTALPVWQGWVHEQRYALTDQVQKVLGEANANIASKIIYNPATEAYEFNAASKQTVDPDEVPIAALQAQAGGGDEDAEQQYSVDLSRSIEGGITYHDNIMGLSFGLTPQFTALEGEQSPDGRVVYPLAGTLRGQLVYTATHKGLKEDIVLHSKPSDDEVVMEYAIDLPDSLDIALHDSGELGVYSADPALYGAIQFGSDDDREMIESMREQGEKTHLAFVIPAPFVVGLDEDGHQSRMSLGSRFVLTDDKQTLRVITSGFGALSREDFPLSIDPSVTITSTSDFTLNAQDEDNNLTIVDGEVQRNAISGGAVNGWAMTSELPQARMASSLHVYNGRIYLVGGYFGAAAPSLIRSATINSDGSLGAWVNAGDMTEGRARLGAALYNGHIYTVAGHITSNGNNVNNVRDTVEYASILQDGTIGEWQNGPPITTKRVDSMVTAYKGYLYVAGGSDVQSATERYSDVQYARINADGSVGDWLTTTSLPTGRQTGQMVAYNDFMYVSGGVNAAGSYNTTTEYAPINADGTLGSWTVTTKPSNRDGFALVVHNGYMYAYGGYVWSGGSQYLNSVMFAPIYADGALGVWQETATFVNGRYQTHGVAHNGFLYIVGGHYGAGVSQDDMRDVQYASIRDPGSDSSYITSTGFGTTRREHAALAYRGHLYMFGGAGGASDAVHNLSQYAPINSDGSLGTVSTTATIGTARQRHTAVAYNGYIYIIGGTNLAGSTYMDTVYRLTVHPTNGTLSGGTNVSTLPYGVYGHASVVHNGYIYLIGGRTSPGIIVGNVRFAQLNADGSIGSWQTTTSMNTARTEHTVVSYGERLYAIGGRNTALYSSVEYTTINTDGTLGSWTNTTTLFGDQGVYEHASFVANGYIYVQGGASNTAGTAGPSWLIRAQVLGDGSLSAWEQLHNDGSSKGADRHGHTTVYHRGHLYIMSGRQWAGGTTVATQLRTQIMGGGEGTVRGWSTTMALTDARQAHVAVAANGYIYVMGGMVSALAATYDSVHYAPINANGTLGAWTATTSLPSAGRSLAAVVSGSRIYVSGGMDGSLYRNTVHYAPINANGTLGAWTATTSLPSARSGHGMVAHRNHLYVTGGQTSGGTHANTVHYAPINANGTLGAWTATSAFVTARTAHTTVIGAGHIYVIGGRNGTNFYTDVQYASINSNGSLEPWETTTSFGNLSPGTAQAAGAVSNGYLYVVGGLSADNTVTNISRHAVINSDGTLGEWTESASISAARHNHAATIYKGNIYVLGGAQTGVGASQTTVYRSPLNSQARLGTYSKVIDVGSAGLISHIGFTGSFGAALQPRAQYRTVTSNNQTGPWRSYNDVDSAQTTGVCGIGGDAVRYVQLRVPLDDELDPIHSQASMTATLGSITVDYQLMRAPTELRLRHGQWFSEQSQQALDTCVDASISSFQPNN